MTGAQGSAEGLEREKRPDQGRPQARGLVPLKYFGQFAREALRKMDWS